MYARALRHLLTATVCLAVSVSIAGAQGAPPPATNALARLPVVFEPNVGQFGPRDTMFAGRTAGGLLRFTDAGVSLERETSRVRWSLHAGKRVMPEGVDPAAGTVNYFVGRDPQRWHTRVPTYMRVRYREVYRGIDVDYYAGADGLEYDVRVSPGADARQVRFSIDGATSLRLDGSGALAIETPGSPLTWRKPVAYQELAGERRPVAVAYAIDHQQVTFQLGSYDRARPLVIDPVFAWSTLLVGAGIDSATDVAVDRDGFVYVTGSSSSSTFPNPDPADGTRPGGSDAFVVKLTPDGTGLVYASFVGGGGIDEALSIAIDPQKHAYVTGFTWSFDWPTQGAIQTSCHLDDTGFCHDAFVAELTEQGDGLVFSTYLGGSGQDYGSAIALGHDNTIVIGGDTMSPDFPVPFAFDSTCDAPCHDGFVAVLSPGGIALEHGTYLGGAGEDRVRDVGILSDGRVAATGDTFSADFPVTKPAFGPTGVTNVFVAVFANDVMSLDASSLLGGTVDNFDSRIAVGPHDALYITGWTNSSDFPVVNALQPVYAGAADAFVTRVAIDTWTLTFSTYFGGSRGEAATGIGVDAAGTAIIVGFTLSVDMPTASAQQRASAAAACAFFRGFPITYCDDAFAAAIDASGRLLYSTYLGGFQDDRANNVFVSADGSAWMVGGTAWDFPTTPGTFHRTSPYQNPPNFDSVMPTTPEAYEPFVARFVPPYATAILTTFAGSGEDRDYRFQSQAVLKALGRPSDVAVMPGGNVLIADSALNRTFLVQTVNQIESNAGSGAAGFRDDTPRLAEFNGPSGITFAGRDIYIADTQNHAVREIVTDRGTTITIAGTGTAGFSGDGGPSTQAQLSGPLALVAGAATIIIADTGNRRIRRITADGTITTIAGTGEAGSSGDGGPAAAATLTLPTGVAFDPSGGIVIADWGANVIRRIAPDGTIATIAGTGTPGYSGDNGPAIAAQLNGPYGVDVDAQGRVYVTDMFNHRVRMIAPDGTIHTVAGTGEAGPIVIPQRAATESPLWYPAGVAVGVDNDLFITDLGNQRVARIIRVDGTVR